MSNYIIKGACAGIAASWISCKVIDFFDSFPFNNYYKIMHNNNNNLIADYMLQDRLIFFGMIFGGFLGFVEFQHTLKY